VIIDLIFVQYMKHIMQITQEVLEYDLTKNSVKFIRLCNKRLHRCQKVTVVFVTIPTPVHVPDK